MNTPEQPWNLDDEDLSHTNLEGADLRAASLLRCDLTGAKLSRAQLEGADARGAILRAAVLRGADLRRCDLRGAELTQSDLTGADLRGAKLWGARLREARLLEANASFGLLLYAHFRGAKCWEAAARVMLPALAGVVLIAVLGTVGAVRHLLPSAASRQTLTMRSGHSLAVAGDASREASASSTLFTEVEMGALGEAPLSLALRWRFGAPANVEVVCTGSGVRLEVLSKGGDQGFRCAEGHTLRELGWVDRPGLLRLTLQPLELVAEDTGSSVESLVAAVRAGQASASVELETAGQGCEEPTLYVGDAPLATLDASDARTLAGTVARQMCEALLQCRDEAPPNAKSACFGAVSTLWLDAVRSARGCPFFDSCRHAALDLCLWAKGAIDTRVASVACPEAYQQALAAFDAEPSSETASAVALAANRTVTAMLDVGQAPRTLPRQEEGAPAFSEELDRWLASVEAQPALLSSPEGAALLWRLYQTLSVDAADREFAMSRGELTELCSAEERRRGSRWCRTADDWLERIQQGVQAQLSKGAGDSAPLREREAGVAKNRALHSAVRGDARESVEQLAAYCAWFVSRCSGHPCNFPTDELVELAAVLGFVATQLPTQTPLDLPAELVDALWQILPHALPSDIRPSFEDLAAALLTWAHTKVLLEPNAEGGYQDALIVALEAQLAKRAHSRSPSAASREKLMLATAEAWRVLLRFIGKQRELVSRRAQLLNPLFAGVPELLHQQTSAANALSPKAPLSRARALEQLVWSQLQETHLSVDLGCTHRELGLAADALSSRPPWELAALELPCLSRRAVTSVLDVHAASNALAGVDLIAVLAGPGGVVRALYFSADGPVLEARLPFSADEARRFVHNEWQGELGSALGIDSPIRSQRELLQACAASPVCAPLRDALGLVATAPAGAPMRPLVILESALLPGLSWGSLPLGQNGAPLLATRQVVMATDLASFARSAALCPSEVEPEAIRFVADAPTVQPAGDCGNDLPCHDYRALVQAVGPSRVALLAPRFMAAVEAEAPLVHFSAHHGDWMGHVGRADGGCGASLSSALLHEATTALDLRQTWLHQHEVEQAARNIAWLTLQVCDTAAKCATCDPAESGPSQQAINALLPETASLAARASRAGAGVVMGHVTRIRNYRSHPLFLEVYRQRHLGQSWLHAYTNAQRALYARWAEAQAGPGAPRSPHDWGTAFVYVHRNCLVM
jgi:hypothetical protein